MLDIKFLKKISKLFDETPIFTEFDEFKKINFLNLFNCVYQRLNDSAEYINSNNNLPSSNSELIVYLYHCFQIYNGIKTIYEVLLKDNSFASNELLFFKDCFKINNFCENVNDDIFFEYFRSISFAHPFETTRRTVRCFMQPGEIHTSNWCESSLNNLASQMNLKWPREHIFVNCYSNKNNNFLHWIIPFSSIQKFIVNKWRKLNIISKEMIQRIESQNNKWKQTKCNRLIQNKIEAFTEIRDILLSRYIENTYEIDRIISYYSTKSSISSNNKSINEFLDDIWNSINVIRDCVDTLNYEEMYNVLDNFVSVVPKQTYKMFMYETEKIHSYLNGKKSACLSPNEQWGLLQAESFSKQFAKKYVTIHPFNMEFEEIILLTDVACYLEAKKIGYLFKK